MAVERLASTIDSLRPGSVIPFEHFLMGTKFLNRTKVPGDRARWGRLWPSAAIAVVVRASGAQARPPERTCSLGSMRSAQSPGSSGQRPDHARQRCDRMGRAAPAAARHSKVSS